MITDPSMIWINDEQWTRRDDDMFKVGQHFPYVFKGVAGYVSVKLYDSAIVKIVRKHTKTSNNT